MKRTLSIEELCIDHGVDYFDFTRWAVGDATVYLDQVPDEWNKRHPENPISEHDECIVSLLMMIRLYLDEHPCAMQLDPPN